MIGKLIIHLKYDSFVAMSVKQSHKRMHIFLKQQVDALSYTQRKMFWHLICVCFGETQWLCLGKM